MFQLIVDGSDITAKVNDRVISIRVVDEIDDKSDGLMIELDDRDFRIAISPMEAEIELILGGVRIGSYVVADDSGGGAPDWIELSAKAGNMRAGIKAPKSRAWQGKSLQYIAGTIAGEHGLEAVVSPDVSAEVFAYLVQRAESDLHFLTRVGREIDAVVKPVDRRLLITKRGSGKDASGAPIPPVVLTRSFHSTYDWNTNGRVRFGKVAARWADIDGGEVRTVELGEEDPVRELRQVFASEAEARRAAQASLDRSKRSSVTFKGTLTGFASGLFAGGLAVLPDMKPELRGQWHLTRVEHVLDERGLVTSYASERDNEEEE